ncbi:hypothetical protein LTR04_000158 [Oleoguttula sp. CCFEE 6159]|nr:hypothetical protein LTR04_000158 [Oleoguttula sp. CCFEE 6159]
MDASPPNHLPSPPVFEGGLNNAPPSTTPPYAFGNRPLSYPTQYSSFEGRLQQSPQGPLKTGRRASMLSQYSRMLFAAQPPLPHQPQPHFYGLPDGDLGAGRPPGNGLVPGSNGYFCGFDTLSAAGHEPSASAENVLLVGSEGGLEVFRVAQKNMDVIGRLEGLGGSVIGARILPWTARCDPYSDVRPLVALVVHGPVLTESPRSPKASESDDATEARISGDSSSTSPSRPLARSDSHTVEITHYHTFVEVYSLRTAKRITMLYTSPAVPISVPVTHPQFIPPPPAGHLRVDANGAYVVVASGSSGEIFVFSPLGGEDRDGRDPFRCIGKVWTSVQTSQRGSTSGCSSFMDANNQNGESNTQSGIPVYSLSERWLAIVPPVSSSVYSLNGTALLAASNPKPPGVTGYMAPPPPTVSCGVDTPEGDGLLNRVARGVAQEVIKGARWVGDQGIQAFRNYWKPIVPEGLSAHTTNRTRDGQVSQAFPPTHAHADTVSPPSNESALVSVLDLQRLLDAEDHKIKNALTPIATFASPSGCSFVSFAPSGLQLLTVSKKGDFQFVWDLMRLSHGKASTAARATLISKTPMPGPHVRQVARFSRMTPANVVDVLWTTPKGERVAILTDKGTVHVFDMPQSSFQWPPPRRIVRTEHSGSPVSVAEAAAPEPTNEGFASSAMSAFQSFNGKARPFVAAVRSRSTSTGSGFPTFSNFSMSPSAAGAKGGRVVAAGLSMGLGAAASGVSTLRHAGDNKLHLHSAASGVSPGTVRWLSGRERGSIAIFAGGTLRLHTVKRMATTRKHGVATSSVKVIKKKSVQFWVPSITDDVFPAGARLVDPMPVEGYWGLRSPVFHPKGHQAKASETAAPLSSAEIDTSPPYQPYHTDRRVNLFAYEEGASFWSQHVHCEELGDPLRAATHSLRPVIDEHSWAFGGDLPFIARLKTGLHNLANEEVYDEYDQGLADADLDDLIGGVAGKMESSLTVKKIGNEALDEEVEQIVFTTRRRKVVAGDEDDGFFEDDCEVLDFAEDRV